MKVVLVEPGAIGTGALDAPRTHLAKDSPYAALAAPRVNRKREELTPPDAIARIVADAAENPDRQFRWEAGDDAIGLIAQREKPDDAAFEASFRKATKLDW